MSALTTLFSSLANKIRSKTGGSDTYTPPEMVDAIDDVYDAGVASATTPITPSNSSPTSMTSGTGYKPTTNGYAIESYDSVTPSSSPASVSSGDVVKIGGSGVIVDAVPTPTSITPSNSSPASMTSGNIYQPTANGVAVESVTNITPSSISPVALTANTPVNPTASGYAIASYQSKTPSTSGEFFNAYFVKMSSSGYAYSEKRPNFLAPDVTKLISSSSGGTTNITVTYMPRYIVLATWNASGSLFGGELAVVDVTNSTAKRMGYGTNGAISWGDWSGYTSYFTSITSSSVTYKSAWSTNACRSMILIYY